MGAVGAFKSSHTSRIKTFIPEVTGFSSITVNQFDYIELPNRMIHGTLMISGASNAATFTATLPRIADVNNFGLFVISIGRAQDNGGGVVGVCRVRSGTSTIIDIYNGVTLGTWTASGTKSIVVNLMYFRV